MDIQHRREGHKGVFFIAAEGRLLAEMTYTMAGEEKMIIEHTEVSDELRGQNIGAQLVGRAVEMARLQHLKILPLCPFANALFRKKTEFHDVLFT